MKLKKIIDNKELKQTWDIEVQNTHLVIIVTQQVVLICLVI